MPQNRQPCTITEEDIAELKRMGINPGHPKSWPVRRFGRPSPPANIRSVIEKANLVLGLMLAAVLMLAAMMVCELQRR